MPASSSVFRGRLRRLGFSATLGFSSCPDRDAPFSSSKREAVVFSPATVVRRLRIVLVSASPSRASVVVIWAWSVPASVSVFFLDLRIWGLDVVSTASFFSLSAIRSYIPLLS